eukprot:TRINITY_DN48140_c0_g1_i1.p1 TRINITY_DN48140_c0_g1~~TRINITY_DN48140_c0_g1_i1.p1  ORF type:complete len:127 (+),score=20.05 TRINITY_DN48140_c0_g1_i1:55-381(+)
MVAGQSIQKKPAAVSGGKVRTPKRSLHGSSFKPGVRVNGKMRWSRVFAIRERRMHKSAEERESAIFGGWRAEVLSLIQEIDEARNKEKRYQGHRRLTESALVEHQQLL